MTMPTNLSSITSSPTNSLNVFSEIKISNRKIKSILHDPEKAAKAVDLIYVNDKQSGIQRVRKGDKFYYQAGKKRIRDEAVLERIKKLVIPPAWQDVWICESENGHLQVTGIDLKGRKQYKYHALWNQLRNHTKFYRLHEFGKSIPLIRKQLKKDLALPGLPLKKVLAAVVSLMEHTSIRVGNSMYEKLYGSFGLTTLKNSHVKITGDKLQFTFKGKKGINHNISLKSKRLAKIVKSCREIPGKELFQYYDGDGNHKVIDSGMLNVYIKSISGQDFTAKDFRTWAGTIQAITAFNEVHICDTPTDLKKNIILVLDKVAEHLGNTRTVCKKYYVHPVVITLYENAKLHSYLGGLNSKDELNTGGALNTKSDGAKGTSDEGLTCEEKILMKILEKEGLVCK